MQILPNGKCQFIDSNGTPLASGQVFFYAPGTTNPSTTYQDQAGTIPNSNPVLLDSNGQAVIWGTGTYRQIVQNSGGVTLWDQVVSAGDADFLAFQSNLSSSSSVSNGDALVAVKQPLSGASARTQHQKNADTISVKDFGAKGDGVADDTAAIQAAVTAAANAGATLHIPYGTYMVSAAINLASNTIIDGEGTIKLINNCTPKPVDILRCNTATNVHVSGITIDANRANNVDHGTPDVNGNQSGSWQGTLLAVIDYAYVTQFSIRNVKVLNSWGSGMWLTDCDTGLVEGNYVKDYRITGIALRNDTNSVLPIQNIRVIGNHCEGGVVGIHSIFGVKDSTISGNVCLNNKDSNKMPAFAYSGTYPNQWPSTGGFTAFGSPGYVSPAFLGDGAGIEATGVFTNPSGTANINVSIAGNTCNLNAVGVRMEETTNSFSVTGNTCRANTIYGILMLSAYFNTVTGNNCIGNGLDGIRMEKITGKPQAGNNQIVGNICTQNGRFGCIVVSSQGNNIVGNNLSGNGSDASQVQNGCLGLFSGVDGVFASNNNIESNVLNNFFGTDKYGIYSDSASNVANILTGNQFSGSYLVAKTTVSIANNTFARNVGFRTESNGAATIGVGNTFVDVPHGLDVVPPTASIRVSPIGDYGSARWWFASADATNIRIQTNAAAAGALPFSWSIAQ